MRTSYFTILALMAAPYTIHTTSGNSAPHAPTDQCINLRCAKIVLDKAMHDPKRPPQVDNLPFVKKHFGVSEKEKEQVITRYCSQPCTPEASRVPYCSYFGGLTHTARCALNCNLGYTSDDDDYNNQ